MKIDRHWRGWRSIERGALLTTCLACTFVASQPARERLTAWQSQRALQAQWQQALINSSRHSGTKSASSHSNPRKLAWHSAQSSLSNEDTSELPILWPITKITCSKIDLDAVVVQGTDEEQLKLGPGHDTNTSFPGGPNCVIAAHRNAYGWWFYRLDNLKRGEDIVVQVPGRKYTYRVVTSRLVSVNDTSILHERANITPHLTLYTCTLPKTEQRLVVIANLKSSEAI